MHKAAQHTPVEPAKQIRRLKAEAAFPEDIVERDGKFRHAAEQRAHRCARNLQTRRAELTKDEHVVKENVDHERHAGHDKANPVHANRSEKAHHHKACDTDCNRIGLYQRFGHPQYHL